MEFIGNILLIVGSLIIIGAPTYALVTRKHWHNPRSILSFLTENEWVALATILGIVTFFWGISWNLFGLSLSVFTSLVGIAFTIIGLTATGDKAKGGYGRTRDIFLLVGASGLTLSIIFHVFSGWELVYSLIGCTIIYTTIAILMFRMGARLSEVFTYNILSTVATSLGTMFILMGYTLTLKGTLNAVITSIGLASTMLLLGVLAWSYVNAQEKNEKNRKVNLYRLFSFNKYLTVGIAVMMAIVTTSLILG